MYMLLRKEKEMKKGIEAIDYYSEGEAVVFLKKGWIHTGSGGDSFTIYTEEAGPEYAMTEEDLEYEFDQIKYIG